MALIFCTMLCVQCVVGYASVVDCSFFDTNHLLNHKKASHGGRHSDVTPSRGGVLSDLICPSVVCGYHATVLRAAFRVGGRRYSRGGGVASGSVNSHGRVRRLPFKRIGEAQNPGLAVHKAVVASYNGNCWTRARRFLNDTKARTVFVQEHKRCRGDSYNSMSAQALRDGWKCCGTHGLKSDLDMPVAGTAVMVRKHMVAKQYPCLRLMCIPLLMAGRLGSWLTTGSRAWCYAHPFI